MPTLCIDCTREQQEFHPEFPELRDWYYGFPGKQRCGDCAIVAGEEGKSLHELNKERKQEKKG